jgi:hypothetical protein
VTLRAILRRAACTEPPRTRPEVACNDHDIDHHRALYRLEPEPPEEDLCRRCWPKSGPKVDLDLPTPAPRARLGEVVTLGGVTGAYLRPVPGGHELRTWRGDLLVLEGSC